ncbi:Polyprenol reductase [Toxocara canis]|uniref:Polyprenal reductase n=1 Tax=Toxocara canis TaxID=6265 RepID=A0A0B2UZG1_TOXCA|nr:Polyprenol reductase [Toxocara canis]
MLTPLVSGVLDAYLLVVTTLIVALGSLNLICPCFSQTLKDLITYERSPLKEKRNFIYRWFAVPKRQFTHFYIIAVINSLLWLAFATFVDAELVKPDRRFLSWMRYLQQTPKLISPTSCYLALSLIALHSLRRLYESLFVCVYSESKMSVVHYASGIIHYALLPLCIVVETSGLASTSKFSVDFRSLSCVQTAGVVLFLLASYNQHLVILQFASLRRNFLGNVTNYGHGILFEGLFSFISCPHFFYEILLYIALYICVGTAAHTFLVNNVTNSCSLMVTIVSRIKPLLRIRSDS